MSKLQEYMYDQYSLILLGSEIDEILALARQEIELPEIKEARKAAQSLRYGYKRTDSEFLAFCEGFNYALRKVHNPYPKPL